MKYLGRKLFDIALILSEKPGEWAAWKIAAIPLVLAVLVGLVWWQLTGWPAMGWAITVGLLVSAAIDWTLLAMLPRLRLSFGAVQPPFLGLVLLRWLVTLIGAPLAALWLVPTLAVLWLLAVLIWGLVVYGTMIEPFRLQVTHLALPSASLANPGMPLRIVQISDIHVERLTRRERALPELINRLAPDIIALTGDFLSTTYNRDPLALADLRAVLEQLHAPAGIYAVLGRFDVDKPDVLRPLFEELGIVLLENHAVEVSIHGHKLWIVGVSCTWDATIDGSHLRGLVCDAPAEVMTLLLYHSPDLMPEATALGVDLYLAGHTHGGQWRLPGFGAIVTSSRYWKRYEAGHYCENGTHLYVSRGLGMEGFGTPRARLFCPPEVVLVTLSGTRKRR